ncbi:MAG: alpha-amylase family glycosyl hydrolase [Candidatus Saccharimonas sp.]
MDENKHILKNIYEINTAVYLNRLGRKYQRAMTLATIPDEEIDEIASFGMDTIWLMGVWQRSPMAIDVSLHDENLLTEIREALPDFETEDMIGSAYAIKNYVVAEQLGGNPALQQFRERLANRDINLILDFVPNHTALDNIWVDVHTEYYVQANSAVVELNPNWYRTLNNINVALGRDPNYPPWSDTAQLNAFSSAYRKESIATLTYLATLCDGVRCDMAMLMVNDTFHGTWGNCVGPAPDSEYWADVIAAVQATSPEFIFIAESYWGSQLELINQGFNFCYDKKATDLLIDGDMLAVESHLNNFTPIVDNLLHFLENHDEKRIAARISDIESLESVIKFIISLPGPKLWYDGQFQGAKIRTPVHIRRSQFEPTNQQVLDLYTRLLHK